MVDGSLHQFWTVGCRLFEVRGPSWTSGPKLASKQFVLEIPSAVSQPLEIPPNKNQFGTSHFCKPPVALPTEFPQKPPKRCIVWKQPCPRWEKEIHLRSLWWRLFELPVPRRKFFLLVEQIIACKHFVERARKRVSRVEAVVSRALEQKVVFEKEVQEGEARLQQLEESQSQRTGDAAASVTELQRRIDDLTRERDSLRAAAPRVLQGVWMGDRPPVVESIPPIPLSSVQDIEGWLSNRNCELRNALEFGDSASVARLGALVAQASAQLASCVQGMQPVGDGQARSFVMAALIDQADAKRRCVEVPSP